MIKSFFQAKYGQKNRSKSDERNGQNMENIQCLQANCELFKKKLSVLKLCVQIIDSDNSPRRWAPVRGLFEMRNHFALLKPFGNAYVKEGEFA